MGRSRSRSISPSRRRDRDRDRDRSRHERDRGYERDRERERDRRRKRSRSRSRDRRHRSSERDYRHSRRSTRSRSHESRPHTSKSTKYKHAEVERPTITAADLEGKSAEEQEMMRMMGFCNFDTTKGKKMPENDVGEVHVILKRKYRQYMNRKGGFNRPLDFVA